MYEVGPILPLRGSKGCKGLQGSTGASLCWASSSSETASLWISLSLGMRAGSTSTIQRPNDRAVSGFFQVNLGRQKYGWKEDGGHLVFGTSGHIATESAGGPSLFVLAEGARMHFGCQWGRWIQRATPAPTRTHIAFNVLLVQGWPAKQGLSCILGWYEGDSGGGGGGHRRALYSSH